MASGVTIIRTAGLFAVGVLGWSADAAPVAAQTYYVGLRGGYVVFQDQPLEFFGGPTDEVDFAGAPTAGAAFGFASHDGWRLEGELSWQRPGIDKIGGLPASGDAEVWAAMTNLYYGIDTGSALTPYLGGGVGAARVSLSDVVAGGGTVDDFDTALAWQAAAGVDFALSDTMTLSLEYRYFVADGLRFDDTGGGRVGLDVRGSSALAGLRFGF